MPIGPQEVQSPDYGFAKNMQTTTEMTWILITFVLLISFVNHSLISEVPLVWGSAMLVDIPFSLMNALIDGFPLLAPLFVLALLYYFNTLLPSAVGEGFTWFVVAAVIILMAGV